MSFIAPAIALGVVGLALLWFRGYKAMTLREMRAMQPDVDLSKHPELQAHFQARKDKILSRVK